MKRKLTFLLTALLLLTGMTSWGQTRTQINWVAADQGYSNGQTIESVDFDSNVSGSFFKGTNNNNPPKYYSTGSAIRCYGGNYFTITTSDGNLTEIVLTFASGEGTNAITTDVGTYSDGTWTGAASSVTFTIGGTSGHRRIAAFDITYGSGSGQQETVATPTFNPAGGTYYEPQSVTINCATQGATICYTTDGTEPDANSAQFSVPLTISETTTIKAKAFKSGYTPSNVASATYTFPSVVNISSITAAGSYTVQGTIVAKSARGFIVGDGTGYVYYYNQNYSQSSYNIGDMVKLSGSVVVYGGVFEFNNSTTVTAATSSNYVAEEPTIITGAEMDSRVASTTPAQLSSYVQYEGTLSISGTHYNITDIDGATTAIGSISYPINTDFTSLEGQEVIVKGYYVGISSSTYYNTMLGSIEEIVVTNPQLTVAPTELSGFQYTYNAGPSQALNFSVTGNDLTSSVSVTAPQNFEVSINSDGPFNNTVTLSPTAGTLNAVHVYVRMKSGLEVGSYSGNVTLASGTLNASVALSGTVSELLVAETPVFSPAGGNYLTAQTVSISSPTTGASIHYTTDGSDPTENSPVYSAPLTVSVTTTIKAVATATGYANSAIAEATYSINETITIAEARALEIDEYGCVEGTVTFIDNRNVYVQDVTAGIVLFLNNNSVPSNLAIGDNVRAYGKRAVYNGLVELSGINGNDANKFMILSSNNSLPLAIKTIAEINADYSGSNMLQSTRVKIVDAIIGVINTNGNTELTQESNSINIYRIPNVEGLTQGDLVTVTGVIGCFNAVQLRVVNASDVLYEHHPVMTATPTSLSGFTYDIDEGGPSDINHIELAGDYLVGPVQVYPSESFEVSTLGDELFQSENPANIYNPGGFYGIKVYVRLKAGLEVGTYEEQLTAVSEGADTLYINVSGTVTGETPTPPDPPTPPTPGDGNYVRISDLNSLSAGSYVIIAARFDDNASDYYAMTAATTGKPTGILFTSATSGNDEVLPASIVDEESNYYWVVGVTDNGYTFTNAAGELIGYTSSTNFTTGGDNTEWGITIQTAEDGAMVPNYTGFVISNVNNEVRAFALNNNHNFGPYHTQNMGGNGYNFYLDLFVKTESDTPPTPTVAAPTFTPAAGTYFEAQNVSISCTTDGATIYFSTVSENGPWEEYEEAITVDESMTIWAYAEKEDYNDSPIASATYVIQSGVVTIFNQDWEGEMNGWTFVNVEGEMTWNIASYQGNHYAYANGFSSGSAHANEDWCISPAFNLNIYSNASLTFRNAMKFTGPDLELYFSNDYDGENPSSATWTELTYVMSEGNYVWTESGVIDLANFTGSNCYIGFKYTSTEEEAAAWEIDDITLVGSTTEPYITATPASLTGFTHTVDNGPSTAQTFVISGGNLPPAPGGQAGGVTISCSNSHYEFSLDGEDYYPYLGISVVGTLEPTTIYVRLNGETVGTYEGTITIEDYATATVSVSGTVTEQPIPGGDWNRIYALSDLHDGDQVIIASRYDATVGDGYYAMTAGVSGKPDGVLFTSVNNNGVEMLPADITDDADTYLWNVTMDGDVITLTNAAGDALGYSSSTNFAGNTSIEWTIAYETAGENAMIPNYTGFLISNAETSNRCIVMNANHKFGAYHTNNINNADYNFYLDLFVQGGSTTPTVATPVFSMASGTYYEEIDVVITCTTEDATIYYTTDGTDPTSASEVYTEAIHVDHDMTLKAIAMKEGLDDSGIASADYVINTDLVIILNQDWEGEMNGWNFVTVEGNKPWTIGTYAGNNYANANGYGDDVDNEQWCISPAFNIDDYANQNVTLSFMNATKFEGPALELYFSNDYDGQDPTQATWQPMSYIASEGNYTWTSSGEISLNGYSGTVCYIAFKYVSTASKSAAAWEIDDILVTADMSNAPYLTATPSALTGFVHDQNAGPSQAQTFVVRGGNLNPEPICKILISVEETLNNGFEISLDGQEYGSSINLFPIDGFMEPTTIYVRLNGQEIGTVSGLIDIVCMDLSTSVTLEGEVLDPFAVQENIAENVRVWCHDNNNIMIENNCGSALQMVVYNILGQPVMGKHINTGSVDLSHNLSSGLYIITLYNEMGSVSTKMVVR